MPSESAHNQPSRFPPAGDAEPEGLLAIGGRLTPDWLLDAYSHGIFPWPEDEQSPVYWWSPDPRAIIELDDLYVSRRLARRLRSGRFEVTFDRAFDRVMLGCADRPGQGTWITDGILAAYIQMHQLGHAHSVEVWRDGRLVGGVYGVAMGGAFAAESMFHCETDASKVALYHLVSHLKRRGFQLLDIQQWTAHTGSLGAIEIPRKEFLNRLAAARELPVVFAD